MILKGGCGPENRKWYKESALALVVFEKRKKTENKNIVQTYSHRCYSSLFVERAVLSV